MQFRARTSAETVRDGPVARRERARAGSAPSPATHLDRSLLVLVVHEAQHDGHVVLFPRHLLALGAGLALLRFDLRHRSARPRVRLRWVRRPVPRGAVWNGGRVRESDRPERAASSESGARRLDESAAEEKRETRRTASKERSENSPREDASAHWSWVSKLRIGKGELRAFSCSEKRNSTPRALSDAPRLRRARCRRPAAVCRTAAFGGSPPPPCTSTSWRTWRRTTRTPRPR